MPQSPSEEIEAASSPELERYLRSWLAIGEMSRQGSSWSGRERNNVFLNTGDGRFADISASSGADFADDARAVAVSDWDQDGDLDLWLASRTGPRLRFLRNRLGGEGDFVALRVRGRSSNRDGIGARVTLELEGDSAPRVQTLRAGEGFLAQSSKWVHFGLAGAARIVAVEVAWPGGGRERFEGVERGGRFLLEEGSATARRLPDRPPIELAPSAAAPEAVAAASGASRIRLTARPPMPPIGYRGFDGSERRLPLGAGPLLVNLWASWCAPCVGELTALERHRDELDEAGLTVVALSVDEEPARARALAERLALGFELGFAAPSELDVLDIFQKSLLEERRRLALPTSFLVDADGRLAVLYKGALEIEELVADLGILDLDDFGIRAATAPLPGRWATLPTPFDPTRLAGEFDSFGHREIAVFYRRSGEEPERLAGRAAADLRRAALLGEQGRAEEAEALLGDLVERLAERLRSHPDDLAARTQLGLALLGLGRGAVALEVFEQVLERDPANRLALGHAAMLAWRGGRRERAEELLERLAASDAAAARELRALLEGS